MSEQFIYASFKDINLNDSFFDSLKNDYSEFTDWFTRKASENDSAFIQTVDGNLEGFLYLKKEEGPITDLEPSLDCPIALKIGTFKIVPHGTRLGERFIKKSLDYAISNSIDIIYVTIFSHHKYLLQMFLNYGFKIHGTKTTDNGEENVLVKDLNEISGNTLKDYPRLNASSNAFLLGIRPQYHTKLFPDSKLFTESFDVIKDVSHSNSITKVYIGRMYSMARIRTGDNLIIYRTTDQDGRAKFRSVATTACTVIDTKSKFDFRTLEDLKNYCKNYSIFTDEELQDFMDDPKKFYVIKMTYNVSLNKRIIQQRLIDEVGLHSNYWGCFALTNSQFRNVLSLGEINNKYLK